MQKNLGIDDLLLLYVDQLQPHTLPSWPQRRARLKIAQAAFGVDFHGSDGDGAMRMLLQSTAVAHLRARGPLDGYLEAGAIEVRIDASDPALRVRAQIEAIDAQVASTRALCLELMRTLFWMIHEPRRTEVPLEELRAAGFAEVDPSVDWD